MHMTQVCVGVGVVYVGGLVWRGSSVRPDDSWVSSNGVGWTNVQREMPLREELPRVRRKINTASCDVFGLLILSSDALQLCTLRNDIISCIYS